MTQPEGKTATDETASAITVVHRPDLGHYELLDNGTTIGATEYHMYDAEHVMFTHTEVSPAYAGQGLASRLARFALDDVRASGRRVFAACPYIAAYVKTHHDYDDIVDPLPLPGQES